MKKTLAVIAIFCALSAVPLFAAAEDKPCTHAEDKVWEPVTPGPFVTFTAPVCCRGELDVQPLYFFNIGRGSFDGEGGYKSLPSRDYNYNQVIQLYTQYGVTDRLEIDTQSVWEINNVKEGEVSAESAGFSDLMLAARYCVLDQTKWLPHATAIFLVKLPTGKYQKTDEGKLDADIIGTGSTDYCFGANFTKGFKPFLLHLDVLYTVSPSPVTIDGVKTEYADTFIINSACEWVFMEHWNLLAELVWYAQGDKKEDGIRTPSSDEQSLIFSTGIGYARDSWQVLVGYQRTLWGQNTDAYDTVAATFIITF